MRAMATLRRFVFLPAAIVIVLSAPPLLSQSARRYSGADGKLRVALAQQPFSPNATVPGPRTMAEGGIQPQLLIVAS